LFELFKRIIKHSFIYAIATILNRAIIIILLPVYTRYLTKIEYGMLELLMITSSIIVLILQLGLGSALFRSVLYKNKSEPKVVTSTSYYFLMINSLFMLFILIFFSNQLSVLLFGNNSGSHLLKVVLLGDFFLIINTIPMGILRIKEQSVRFAVIASINFVIGIVLNVVLVIVLKKGLQGVVIGNALAAMITSIIYFLVIKNELLLKFSFNDLKDMLGFGLPLVPASIASLILNMSDRYFIRYFNGLEEVAVYGVAVRVSMVMTLMVGSFQMAWPAILFSVAKNDNAKIFFSKMFNNFLLFLTFVGLTFSIFSKEIIRILSTNEFVESANVLPLLIIASIFYGVYFYTSIGIQIKKKTIYFPLVILIVAIMNFILCYFLIPLYGYLGAGIAKLISYIILGLVINFISLHYYKIYYKLKKIFILIILSLSIYIISINLNFQIIYLSVILKIILLLSFLALLIIFGYFEKSELQKLKLGFKSKLNIS